MRRRFFILFLSTFQCDTSLQNLSLRIVVVSPFLLIANVVSDKRTSNTDFEHWDLDKDGVLTGYEVIANTSAFL